MRLGLINVLDPRPSPMPITITVQKHVQHLHKKSKCHEDCVSLTFFLLLLLLLLSLTLSCLYILSLYPLSGASRECSSCDTGSNLVASNLDSCPRSLALLQTHAKSIAELTPTMENNTAEPTLFSN
jgi:hypothetical protein